MSFCQVTSLGEDDYSFEMPDKSEVPISIQVGALCGILLNIGVFVGIYFYFTKQFRKAKHCFVIVGINSFIFMVGGISIALSGLSQPIRNILLIILILLYLVVPFAVARLFQNDKKGSE